MTNSLPDRIRALLPCKGTKLFSELSDIGAEQLAVTIVAMLKAGDIVRLDGIYSRPPIVHEDRMQPMLGTRQSDETRKATRKQWDVANRERILTRRRAREARYREANRVAK